MLIYHSTDWAGLEGVLNTRFIMPHPLSEDAVLADIRQLGMRGIWFSNRYNSGNNFFGAFSFGYDDSDLIIGDLIDWGPINGRRTLISLPSLLSREVSSITGNKIVPREELAQIPEFNLIVVWPVPAAETKFFDISDAFTDRRGMPRKAFETTIEYATAGMLSRLLVRGETFLNRVLADKLPQHSQYLFKNLIGWPAGFEKRREEMTKAIGTDDRPPPSVCLDQALQYLGDRNGSSARMCAACIDDPALVAKEVADRINKHFAPQPEIDPSHLMSVLE